MLAELCTMKHTTQWAAVKVLSTPAQEAARCIGVESAHLRLTTHETERPYNITRKMICKEYQVYQVRLTSRTSILGHTTVTSARPCRVDDLPKALVVVNADRIAAAAIATAMMMMV